MSKLHELLAVEETVVSASEKLMSETEMKFGKISEVFTGSIKTLERLQDTAEDKAIEASQKQVKVLPTNVRLTMEYVFPYMEKHLNLKLAKHRTNQKAMADIVLDDEVLVPDAPVDFLLDLEKLIPRLRKMFVHMPTLDPSKEWVEESKGTWKTKEPLMTTQTEKIMYPVVMHEATVQHPAQVKESTKDIVVGTFSTIFFSGATTTQQKADVLAKLDDLLSAVKQARMRANSINVEAHNNGGNAIVGLLNKILVP
jgi:hypothetical protein